MADPNVRGTLQRYPYSPFLMFFYALVNYSTPAPFQYGREEHIQRKIDLMVKEAKEKMAKKDKKGE